MTPEQLRQYLSFYQDLGFKTLYRRGVAAQQDSTMTPKDPDESLTPAPSPEPPNLEPPNQEPPPPPPSRVSLGGVLPSIAPEDDTLVKIQADIGDCTRCRLHEQRHKIVFGVGNGQAKVVFVGEGPGADEDAQGIPFVGRAGQLLTQMIDNTAKGEGIPIERKDVYICNVVKCRPPENRTPEKDEMETCGQFLFRQLMVMRPKAIVALGGTAARALLDKREGVTRLRGNWHRWHDFPVMVTFHPSYLLRPYNKNAKREAWEDLKKVFHYVYD